MDTPSISWSPRTVEDIFKDYSGRRNGVIRALTYDVDKFYSLCDPAKENLCLFGYPDGTWKVALPAEEVPPELPEPSLGINFARDGMDKKHWMSLVAAHTDSWLLYVAFYYGARVDSNGRKRLFSLINDLPTVCETVTAWKPIKDKASMHSGSKSITGTKRSSNGQSKSNLKPHTHIDEEDSDEQGETLCGTCGGNDSVSQFWIGCDVCEQWFHGKCVKITPAMAEDIKQYKCLPCRAKSSR